MHIVSTRTTIPVPKVHRLVHTGGFKDSFIEMDYVDGVDLHELWPTMSWLGRLRVVWTLRGYIRQLRQLRIPFHSAPGPLHPKGQPQVCFARISFPEDGAGPFPSYKATETLFNMMRGVTL